MLSKNLFDEKTLEVNSISDYLTVTTPLPQYLPYPRFLLDTNLSHTAKLLYTLLLDRATLSQKNNWIDAGKSGKSIEGRASFCRMMEDIKSGKDGVAYVLVFKLSRFGRNAADVLSTLQVMQDFGVNLICVEDGIDSSKDAGKLMISVLSAVAEIERENIRVQTMEGRIQKAREGRWNGGFAPYGYRLVDGVLQINEDETPAIRTIFEQYAPNERKMAHPINLSLITVASIARCNVGKNAISTSKFRKKFWTTPWWRLSSNWSAIQSLPL